MHDSEWVALDWNDEQHACRHASPGLVPLPLAKCQGLTAQRTTAVGEIVKAARRAILCTGTPALSRPVELYAQVHGHGRGDGWCSCSWQLAWGVRLFRAGGLPCMRGSSQDCLRPRPCMPVFHGNACCLSGLCDPSQVDMLRPGMFGSLDEFGLRYCDGRPALDAWQATAPSRLDLRCGCPPACAALPAARKWYTRSALAKQPYKQLWQNCRGAGAPATWMSCTGGWSRR